MGVMFDDAPAADPAPVQPPSPFVQGLRSGTSALQSQFHAGVGRLAETAGLADAAAEHYQQSADLQRQSATEAPAIGKFSDVHSLGDFGDYAGGLAGEAIPGLVPAVGAGLLAKTPLGKLAAGTAATLPMTVGQQIQEQQADPTQAATPVGDRNLVAGGVGLGQAAAMNVVPQLVGGKLAGNVEKAAAKVPLKDIIAKNAAEAVGGNAAAGAASTALDQAGQTSLNPNRDTSGDAEAIKESAIAGGVTGAPFGALGAAGEALHGRVGTPGAKDAATGALERAKGLFKATPNPDDTAAQRVSQGLPLVDDAKYATAAPADAARMEQEGDQTALQRAAAWATELAKDNLPEETQQKLAAATANLADKGNQAYVASLKVAKDVKGKVTDAANGLLDALGKRSDDENDPASGAPRIDDPNTIDMPRSEGDAGPHAAVANALVAAKVDPQVAAANARGVAGVIDQAQRTGQISAVVEARLHAALGDDAASILTQVHDSIAGGDPKKSENFYQAMADVSDRRQQAGSLRDAVRDALPKAVQPTTTPEDIDAIVDGLKRHTSGQDFAHLGPAEAAFKKSQVEQALEQHFPGKSKELLDRFAKEQKTDVEDPARPPDAVRRPAGESDDAHEAVQEQLDNEHSFEDSFEKPTYYGGGRDPKNPTYVDHPDQHFQKFGNDKSPAKKLMDKAIAENPDRSVHLVSAVDHAAENGRELTPEQKKALEGKVIVEARGHNTSEALTKDELGGMKLDSKNFADSKSRIDYGEGSLDAVRLTEAMQKKLPYNASDEKGPLYRKARAFYEGIAAASDALGKKIDLHDNKLQISRDGTTLGEIRKLVTTSQPDAAGRTEHEVSSLKFTPSMDPNAERREALRELPQKDIEDHISKLETRLEGMKADDPRADKVREALQLAKDEVENRATDKGEMAYDTAATDRAAQIHTAAKENPKDLVNKTSMDGSAIKYSSAGKDSPKVQNQVIAAKVSQLKEGRTALQRSIGRKLEALHADASTDLDRMALTRMVREKDSIKQAQLINDAFAKKDLTAKPDAKMTPAKVEAEKKSSFVDRINRGDTKEILDRVSNSYDAQGLRDAAQAVFENQSKHSQKVLEAINDRLSDLIHDDPSKAYSLQLMHASPHTFEKFDWASNMSRGEGAQAFGYGGYFASSKDVAAFYKDKFTNPERPDMPRANYDKTIGLLKKFKRLDILNLPAKVGDTYPRFEALKKLLVQSDVIGRYEGRGADIYLDRDAGALATSLEGSKGYDPTKKAPLYNVEAKIDPHEILDYDKPLSEQRDILDKIYDDPLLDKNYEAHQALAERGDGLAEDTGKDFYEFLSDALGGDRQASEALDAAGIKGHKYLDGFGRKAGDGDHNYVIYDAKHVDIKDVQYNKQQTSAQSTNPSQVGVDPKVRKDVEDHIDKVLGQTVGVAWKKILHAGEFEAGKNGARDMIRLSVHAFDPMSVAYHESLHAFMQQLRTSGDHQANKALFVAADTHVVRAQLEKLLANEPEALKQIRASSEERAAYMYQFWAAGKLTVGDKSTTVLGRIRDFIHGLIGTWSNDDRAQHIMEYFNSGEYAKNIGDRNAVSRALLEGTNPAIEKFKEYVAPFRELGNAIASAGDARMRGFDNPALTKIADLVLKQGHGAGVNADQGFIPAAREARSQTMNKLAQDLRGIEDKHLDAALEGLQSAKPAATPEGRAAQAVIRRTLDRMHDYLTSSGVDVGDQGKGKDYFPRVWDPDYLTSHQDDFRAMLDKYTQTGEFKGSADEVIQKLIRGGGAENAIETKTPGFQSGKQRVLDFIKPEDFAPFGEKNLWRTMDAYITQATRRGEWAQRFGDGSEKLNGLLKEAADKHGATPEQIAVAEKYMKAVNGTLGDNINPKLRRAMGNMMVYQNIRLLPLAIFSSVIDPLGVVVRGGTIGDAFSLAKRGFAEIPRNFQKAENRKSDEAYKLAEDVGVIDNAMLLHTLGSAYSQGMVGNTGRKINDTFFRFNLMEQYNTSMRVGATEAAVKFIGKHADGTFSPHSERWMAELGYKPGEVKLDATGRPLISADDFKASGMSNTAAAAAANKMASAINNWVDGAILRPNAAHKPIWANDPHFALMAHLKQFVYSFQHTIIDRVVNEAEHGNLTPGVALASYVPIMIAADLAKGYIQGGGQQPDWKEGWTASDYAWSGVQRAGLLGSGQFAVDAVEHKSGLLGLAGPTIEQFGDAVKVVGGNEQFKPFFNKSLPANALYSSVLGGQATDPTFSD